MDLTGKLIDDTFHLERRLGSGAAGDVYLARLVRRWRRLPADKEVALKHYKDWLFEGGDEKQAERIKREALLSEVKHKNLVRIFGVGSTQLGDSHLHYLVMEVVHGQTLSNFIREHSPLSLRQIKSIIVQLCEAVGALHERGKFHRDIKPDNMMVIGKDKPRVKLMDFGVISDFNRPTVTESHEFLGTVRYAAPEWILGTVGQSQTSQILLDLYSLGAVLADLINGYPLFPEVNSRFQLAALKTDSEPQVVREDIPISFITVAQSLIAIDPRERQPANAAHLLKVLQSLNVGKQLRSTEDDLERSLVSFNNLRKEYRNKQASLERATKQMESISSELLTICEGVRDFLATKFRLEEWKHSIVQPKDYMGRAIPGSIGKVSFGISASEADALFFPMTISIWWRLDEQRKLKIELAGFYSWIYYSRRTFTDALAAEVNWNWSRLLSDLDTFDAVYEEKYIKQAVQEVLKNAVLKVVNVFLKINKAEILAREKGSKLDYLNLGKLRINGEIMAPVSHQSSAEEDTICLLRECPADRKEGSFLCRPHDCEFIRE